MDQNPIAVYHTFNDNFKSYINFKKDKIQKKTKIIYIALVKNLVRATLHVMGRTVRGPMGLSLPPSVIYLLVRLLRSVYIR
jgi:hypothetical protein